VGVATGDEQLEEELVLYPESVPTETPLENPTVYNEAIEPEVENNPIMTDAPAETKVSEVITKAKVRSGRINAGMRRPDPAFEYSMHNISVKKALKEHGNTAAKACYSEFKQLFQDKKA